jgi:hypothetical protein
LDLIFYPRAVFADFFLKHHDFGSAMQYYAFHCPSSGRVVKMHDWLLVKSREFKRLTFTQDELPVRRGLQAPLIVIPAQAHKC